MRESRAKENNSIHGISALHCWGLSNIFTTGCRRVKCSKRKKERMKNLECPHIVQSNDICYSGPFYANLITCSNAFCETPSSFEDTPTTHVIWLVFYMRYQPSPIIGADQNVPVIWWGGDSLRWNDNMGHLKTDSWITGFCWQKKKRKKRGPISANTGAIAV